MPDLLQCLTKWGFKRGDPFEERFPDEHLEWAGPREDFEYLRYLLQDVRQGPRFLNILLQGEYGTGKTFTMKAAARYVEKDLGGLPIYIEIPTRADLKGFIDLYKLVTSRLGIGRLSEIATALKTVTKAEKRTDLQEQILHMISSQDVAGRDLAEAFANIAFSHESFVSGAWLLGEATYYQAKSAGFFSRPSDDTAVLLTDILRLCKVKYPIVVLMVDELENLVGISKAVRDIQEGLRDLYDAIIAAHTQGFALITATTGQYAYELRRHLGSAFSERIDETLVLKGLTSDEAREFVQDLFAYARGNGERDLTPIFGSSEVFERFLNLIHMAQTQAEATGAIQIPRRRILKAGKILLRRACFRGKRIDEALVNEIIPGLRW